MATETSTVAPADGPDGTRATREPGEVTEKDAGVAPNRTDVAPAKL